MSMVLGTALAFLANVRRSWCLWLAFNPKRSNEKLKSAPRLDRVIALANRWWQPVLTKGVARQHDDCAEPFGDRKDSASALLVLRLDEQWESNQDQTYCIFVSCWTSAQHRCAGLRLDRLR